ncbi:hypothetical protein A0244_18230 [Salmonella enterica subsp. enterica serovar Derby]|uniref:Uncharacterized protein n=1 Tax=Salmonella enterica subsp. enterica serovar Agona TaxID=58095 RepID=A0A5V6M4S7_SALET|nr:hypothetical protein [Salmonella enterica]EBR6979871.1 hypothetical protein [Salmonella enterica]EBU7984306.1 hypothetical protein [Salmonella enterica subsp. enterica serovar Agona]ECZ9067945.1 hypothetical protein [Salmonella enterica subsp. enterica serovar Derby]
MKARCAVGLCGLRPVPTSPSRPFGFNPSRLRAYGAARSACVEGSAPPQRAGLVRAYAPACCGRLCKSVPSSTLAVRRLYVMKDGSPTHRPALQWSFHTTPHAKGRKQREGRFHLVAWHCPCPCQGAGR